MTPTEAPPLAATVGRGVAAGLAGTAVMTGFQKLVEMPLTGRKDSYAPAMFAERVFPIGRKRGKARKRLNYAVHFGLGAGWGAAFAAASRAGLRGQRAVAAVFAVFYATDVALNTALGLYEPQKWSGRDWAIDVGDKLVQAQASGLVFDRLSSTS